MIYACYNSLHDFRAAAESVVHIKWQQEVVRTEKNGREGLGIRSQMLLTANTRAGIPGGLRLVVECPFFPGRQSMKLTADNCAKFIQRAGTTERMNKALTCVQKFFKEKNILTVNAEMRNHEMLEDLKSAPLAPQTLWKIVESPEGGGRRLVGIDDLEAEAKASEAKRMSAAAAQARPQQQQGNSLIPGAASAVSGAAASAAAPVMARSAMLDQILSESSEAGG